MTPDTESEHLTSAVVGLGDELPPGQLEYFARSAIRDLVRLHGFEGAREIVAFILADEADRRH